MSSASVNILASFSASFSKLSEPSVSRKKMKQLRVGLKIGSDHIQMPWVQLETEASTWNWIVLRLLLVQRVRACDLGDSFYQFASFQLHWQNRCRRGRPLWYRVPTRWARSFHSFVFWGAGPGGHRNGCLPDHYLLRWSSPRSPRIAIKIFSCDALGLTVQNSFFRNYYN